MVAREAPPASIEPLAFAYRGFVLSRMPLALPSETWWSRVAVPTGFGVLLASNEEPSIWRARVTALFKDMELAEYLDEPRGVYRVAAFSEGRLAACLFFGKAGASPTWDIVKTLFEGEALDNLQRRVVLSGKSTEGVANAGPVVCACFGVGLNTIRAALASNSAASVEEIGSMLRAGTNCGSCLPELKRIVNHERIAQTA